MPKIHMYMLMLHCNCSAVTPWTRLLWFRLKMEWKVPFITRLSLLDKRPIFHIQT